MNEMVNNSEILEKINRIRKPVNDVYTIEAVFAQKLQQNMEIL